MFLFAFNQIRLKEHLSSFKRADLVVAAATHPTPTYGRACPPWSKRSKLQVSKSLSQQQSTYKVLTYKYVEAVSKQASRPLQVPARCSKAGHKRRGTASVEGRRYEGRGSLGTPLGCPWATVGERRVSAARRRSMRTCHPIQLPPVASPCASRVHLVCT